MQVCPMKGVCMIPTRALEVTPVLGGTLSRDDYGDKKPGVKKAVHKFISNTGLKLNNRRFQFEVKV